VTQAEWEREFYARKEAQGVAYLDGAGRWHVPAQVRGHDLTVRCPFCKSTHWHPDGTGSVQRAHHSPNCIRPMMDNRLGYTLYPAPAKPARLATAPS
jgi:hypothetical protein